MLTDARVERARKVLRLIPSIAVNRRKEFFKRANVTIKDVQKQWKQTFEPPRKKPSKVTKQKTEKTPAPDGSVQCDFFDQW